MNLSKNIKASLWRLSLFVSISTHGITHLECHHALNKAILNHSFIQNHLGVPRQGLPSANAICSSSGNKRPRIAHCIAGSARTLWSPKAYETIQHNFIEALGGEYNTFMYLYRGDTKNTFTTPTKFGNKNNPHGTNSIDFGNLKHAIDVLQPTTLVIAPEKTPDTYSAKKAGCYVYDDAKTNLLGQVDTLRDVYYLVEQYEAEYSIRFDWVTRIRPDLSIISGVTPWCFLDKKYFYVPRRLWIDHLGIFSRQLSDAFFHIIDRYFGCGKKVDWTYEGKNDLQQYFHNQPPLANKRKSLDVPSILLRTHQNDVEPNCIKFMKSQPWVFGSIGLPSVYAKQDNIIEDNYDRGSIALKRCMMATWVGDIDDITNSEVLAKKSEYYNEEDDFALQILTSDSYEEEPFNKGDKGRSHSVEMVRKNDQEVPHQFENEDEIFKFQYPEACTRLFDSDRFHLF